MTRVLDLRLNRGEVSRWQQQRSGSRRRGGARSSDRVEGIVAPAPLPLLDHAGHSVIADSRDTR
jgi:hypothetical protein